MKRREFPLTLALLATFGFKRKPKYTDYKIMKRKGNTFTVDKKFKMHSIFQDIILLGNNTVRVYYI